jgi:hypothetical protein
MTENRKAAIALIAGAIGGIVTMILHPTSHDLFMPGQLASISHLSGVVHTLAIASMPLLFLGALALSRRLASTDHLSVSALVVFGFALAAEMVGAVLSGFVAGGLGGEMIASGPPASDVWRILFNYNGRLNQAFIEVSVVASSTAIVLWSASIVRSRRLAPGIGVYGLFLGVATIIAFMSGHLRLDVNGMGLVVFIQAVWYITVGILLWRLKETAGRNSENSRATDLPLASAASKSQV